MARMHFTIQVEKCNKKNAACLARLSSDMQSLVLQCWHCGRITFLLVVGRTEQRLRETTEFFCAVLHLATMTIKASVGVTQTETALELNSKQKKQQCYSNED